MRHGETYIFRPRLDLMRERLYANGVASDDAEALLAVLEHRLYGPGKWAPGRVGGHDLAIMFLQALSDYKNHRPSGRTPFTVVQLLKLFIDDQAVVNEACDVFN